MEKEIEKVSIKSLKSDNHDTNITTIPLSDYDDTYIIVKHVLNLTEMLQFVKDIVDSCIDEDTYNYTPEAYDFAVRIAVLTYYSNIDIPNEIEEKYWLAYQTDLFSKVLEQIEPSQFNESVRAAEKKIKYHIDLISSTAANKINEFIEKFENIFNVSDISSIGLNPSDISNIVYLASKAKSLDDKTIVAALSERPDNIANASPSE